MIASAAARSARPAGHHWNSRPAATESIRVVDSKRRATVVPADSESRRRSELRDMPCSPLGPQSMPDQAGHRRCRPRHELRVSSVLSARPYHARQRPQADGVNATVSRARHPLCAPAQRYAAPRKRPAAGCTLAGAGELPTRRAACGPGRVPARRRHGGPSSRSRRETPRPARPSGSRGGGRARAGSR